MRALLLLLFLLLQTFAQNNQSAPLLIDENLTLPSLPPSVDAKTIYTKSSIEDANIFVNGIYKGSLDILVLLDGRFDINVSFIEENQSNSKIVYKNLTKSPQRDSYTLNYRFKPLQEQFFIPDINITVRTEGNNTVNEIVSTAKNRNAIALPDEPGFSNVLAKELRVENFKSSRYDKTHNIMVIELEASYSNLEDFNLSSYDKQGIESFSHPKEFLKNIIYYVVLPANEDELVFRYFDTDENDFVKLEIPNIMQESSVSTQSEIQPRQTFQMYKILASVGVMLFIGVLFIAYRKYVILLLLLFPLLYLAYILLPFKEITLKEGARITILPTENSTVFYSPKRSQQVKMIQKQGEYYKILIDEERIGWVKDEDIRKD